MEEFRVSTDSRTQMLDITSRVQEAVDASGIREGFCMVWVPHTTAGVTVNENADPSVVRDILMEINKIVPDQDDYRHGEGNSPAHIKSSVFGCSAVLPVTEGELLLGTWQGVYFCEFDGPRSRKVQVICR